VKAGPRRLFEEEVRLSVVAKIEARRADLEAKVVPALASEPFAGVMRKATWKDHRRAETSTFETALVDGSMTEAPYADLLVQLLPVYHALEAREAELAGDPLLKGLLEPGLHRAASIENDIQTFLGDAPRPEMLPVSVEYAERVRNADAPRFIAHHYTRYLADLSGGFMIHDGLTKAFGDPDRGLSYYRFPAIPDPIAFKVGYRDAINDLPVDDETKIQIVEEVAIAYEFNIEMVAELATRHGLEPQQA
jgi:heme oxygenase (biliverdin-producing, ferredoxin)